MISACSFSERACKDLYAKAAGESFDLVIVPGAPFRDSSWSRVIKGRIYWAKFLFDQGIARNIMFSGSAVYTPYTEALVMAMYAEAIGIPKEHIFTEIRAEHSTENVFYSYQKARSFGFSKIAIASDPFQTKMLRSFTFNKVSQDIWLIPFVVHTLKAMQPAMENPSIDFGEAFVPGFRSIVKRESFMKRIKGTFGKNIDRNAYSDAEIQAR
jgi:hypothetical protein